MEVLVLHGFLRCSGVANLSVLVLCYRLQSNAHGECDGGVDTVKYSLCPSGTVNGLQGPVQHIWMISDTAGEFIGEN